MKQAFILILFLLPLYFTYPNRIDELKSTEEIVEFVKSVHPRFEDTWREFTIPPTEELAKELDCDGVFQEWGIKNWEKVDLTNDGLTDLLFISHQYGYAPYAIIDNGDGSFKVHSLWRSSFEKCELAKSIKLNDKNHLKIYQARSKWNNAKDLLSLEAIEYKFIDTLTYKFDSFVELNDDPANYKIEKIEFKSGPCDGTCPVFSLVLDTSGKVDFDGAYHVNFQGESSMNIGVDFFQELTSILNYIRVKELEDDYQVTWTDDATAFLTVTFANGEKKRIRDYGMQQTYGLIALYKKLTKLALQTDWE
jgi:hypothetical protein